MHYSGGFTVFTSRFLAALDHTAFILPFVDRTGAEILENGANVSSDLFLSVAFLSLQHAAVPFQKHVHQYGRQVLGELSFINERDDTMIEKKNRTVDAAEAPSYSISSLIAQWFRTAKN